MNAASRDDDDGCERLRTSLGNQIDDIVCQLYDITPDERKVIEGKLIWPSRSDVRM